MSSNDTEKVSSEQKISIGTKVTELNLQITDLVADSEHKENEYAEKRQALEETIKT